LGKNRNRVIVILGFAFLISLNLFSFILAYPHISELNSGCCGTSPLARDFSAFYVGAWRLFNDPSQVYFHGNLNDGGSQIYPRPEQYKYLPSFLFLVTPLIFESYNQAIITFDLMQFLILPVVALLIYKLVIPKGVLLTLLPSPGVGWEFSAAFYWQWSEGQSKVLETFLVLLSLYLAHANRPKLSGVLLGISFFDPRFSLVALPLFLTFNKKKLRESLTVLVATVIISNLPLFYPGMGSGFVSMLISTGIRTELYPYAFIPFVTVVVLSLVYSEEIVNAFREFRAKDRTGKISKNDQNVFASLSEVG
jgi:glycosyl transferase family 87